MTPKVKAIELLNRFEFASVYFIDGSQGANMMAKESALRCVDEIEIALTEYGNLTDDLQNMDSEWRFLEQVKKELYNFKL